MKFEEIILKAYQKSDSDMINEFLTISSYILWKSTWCSLCDPLYSEAEICKLKVLIIRKSAKIVKF